MPLAPHVTVTWTLYGQPVSQTQCNLSALFDLVTVTLKDQDVSHNRSAFAPCKDGILRLTGVVPGQYTAEGAIYFSSATGGGVASTMQQTVTVVDAQTATVNFDFQPSLVTLTTYQGQAPANAAWVAFRNGNDQWRQIQGTSGRYSFAPSIDNGGRYSLAIGCNVSTFAGAVFEVRTLELTTSDTTSPAVGCDDLASRVQVSGALSNFPAGHCVQGTFFDVNSALTGPDSARKTRSSTLGESRPAPRATTSTSWRPTSPARLRGKRSRPSSSSLQTRSPASRRR